MGARRLPHARRPVGGGTIPRRLGEGQVSSVTCWRGGSVSDRRNIAAPVAHAPASPRSCSLLLPVPGGAVPLAREVNAARAKDRVQLGLGKLDRIDAEALPRLEDNLLAGPVADVEEHRAGAARRLEHARHLIEMAGGVLPEA